MPVPKSILRLRGALAPLALLTLAACGGGGGGGGDGGTPQPAAPGPSLNLPPPLAPVVAPSYPALEITAATVPAAYASAQRVLEEAPPIASFVSYITALAMGAGPTSFGGCPILPAAQPVTVSHFDVDATGTVTRGDILQFAFIPCTGDRASLVFRPTFIDTAAQRLEGRVEMTTQGTSVDGVDGSFDLVSTVLASTNRSNTLSNLSLALRTNGQVDFVTGGRMEIGIPSAAAPGYSFEFEANVAIESLGRSYRVSTPATLRGVYGAVPSEGTIVVESLAARARIEPAADPADREDLARLALDPTGANQYGAPTSLPWARLVRNGNWFNWFPNTRPRITRLELSPATPNRLDTLTPAYDAFDYDGDMLQFFARWKRNGVELPFSSPTLPPGNFVRGDVIELTLQAQDLASGVARRSMTFTIGNAPPSVTAEITPTAPMSVRDLALSSTASDPDGDPLTTTYAWRVSGAALPNQSTPSLSHTRHAKNDVVTGVVAVSDGFATATAEASVTILDTPGNVTITSPPAGVGFGNAISFAATASDYDGDDTSTKDFRLVYGPAGMTVHPDTGVVSWTARGPMFDRTLNVNYGIGIEEKGSSFASGSFVVTNSSHVPPLSRGPIAPAYYDGLRAGNFDADSATEIVVLNEYVYEMEKPAGAGYRHTWADFRSFSADVRPTAIAVGDVDGDSRAELFVAHGNVVLQYSGVDRGITDRIELPVPQDYMCGQLELADLDRNGTTEIACLATYFAGSAVTASGVIVVLAARTLDVVKQYPLDSYGGSIAVGNVDNDAALELVTAAGHVFDGGAVVGPAFATQWRYAPGFGGTIEVGDVNGDGIAEIVGLDRNANVVDAFDARTLNRRWRTTIPSSVTLYVADVTGDAAAEILVGSTMTGIVRAYRQTSPTAASELFSVEFGNNAGVAAIAAGNFDADPGIEIIASGESAAWFGIAGGNTAPQIEWRFGSGGSALEVGWGFIGGEQLGADLVFAAMASDETQRLVRVNTTDGSIALSGPVGSYGNLDVAFTIADYDRDGVREALIATEDNVDTRLLAYNIATNTTEWSSLAALDEFGPADVAYADFTGDNRDELVVLAEKGTLRVYDIAANHLLYERPSSAITEADDVAVVNLDGAGMPEIVATIDDRVVVLSRTQTGFAVTATSAQFVGTQAMEVTDIDGDGALDIFVLYGDSGTPARLARLDRFLLLRSEAALGEWASDMTTERSTFARKNLLLWRSDFTSELFAADPVSGAEVWRGPRFVGHISPDSVRFHDLAGNGTLSLSIGTNEGITLTR